MNNYFELKSIKKRLVNSKTKEFLWKNRRPADFVISDSLKKKKAVKIFTLQPYY
jgi:hypothetical protein